MAQFKNILKKIGIQKGFTFVEILLVVAIIGILATFLAGNFVAAKQRGRDSKRKADLSLIQAALEQYKADNNLYPCFSLGDCDQAHAGWDLISKINSANVNDLPSKYINKIPVDPTYTDPLHCTVANPGYAYIHSDNLQQYAIFANLENTNDPDVNALKPIPALIGSCAGGLSKCASYTFGSGSCAGVTYNYWVTNP